MTKKPWDKLTNFPSGAYSFLLCSSQKMILQLTEKRYHDGKFSFLLLAVTLPIQILAWGWLAYQYCWTGEVTFIIPPSGLLQKYTGWLFISPALIFFSPFALWYFPYLSGGGKLAMTFFSLAIYRMTLWCTQILYRWYAWQDQLRQLQTQAADQLGYINNTITDWYGLLYIKFKETAPIYQHNAEYLIQQQLNRFQVGSLSDFTQKYGPAATNRFQEKLEEIKQFSIQLLANRLPDDLDPAPKISVLLEKKIQAELPPVTLLTPDTPWWEKGWEKIQRIDWSNPQVKTVAYAVGGLILIGITYWGVHALMGYFLGGDKRIENLAGIATNQEKDITELVSHFQATQESNQAEFLSLLQGLKDNQQMNDAAAEQILALHNHLLQPQVQNLIQRSDDLLQLVGAVDPGSIALLCEGVQELQTAFQQICIIQEQQQSAISSITTHFYRFCDRLNLQIISELRPRK